MTARILLVGVLALVAIFLIAAAITFLAPFIAIGVVGYLMIKFMRLTPPTEPTQGTELIDVTPRKSFWDVEFEYGPSTKDR
jgi:hypothetical protein